MFADNALAAQRCGLGRTGSAPLPLSAAAASGSGAGGGNALGGTDPARMERPRPGGLSYTLGRTALLDVEPGAAQAAGVAGHVDQLELRAAGARSLAQFGPQLLVVDLDSIQPE